MAKIVSDDFLKKSTIKVDAPTELLTKPTEEELKDPSRKYEFQVAKYLEDLGFKKIMVTPKSGDYGVDVIATYEGVRYAVQCKLYAEDVGVDAVYQVVAGAKHWKCDRTMVVTSGVLTSNAKQIAEDCGTTVVENFNGTTFESTEDYDDFEYDMF